MDWFLSVNVGVLGVMTLSGDFIGGYIYAGPSVMFPTSERLTFIPGLLCEVDPIHGNWGCGANITVGWLLTYSLELDVSASIISDTGPSGRTTAYGALGPSLTLLIPAHVEGRFMAVSLGAQPTLGLRSEGWSISAPVINVSLPLP